MFYAILLLLVVLSGAVGGLIFFNPREAKERLDNARVALGLTTRAELDAAQGPPFNALAAGRVMGEVALQAGQCREPNGPEGKGRVQVLYAPNGSASSVAVSRPFHETSVGGCIEGLFQATKVPAFGGQSVIVTKTFDLR